MSALRPAAGAAAALAVAGLVSACVGAVLWRAGGLGAPGPADWAALRFTVLQAALSAALSCAAAVPVARALNRRSFPLRRALIVALGAPFLLPVIVAILGLLAIFGRAGLISQLLGLVRLPPVSIYGLHGIVLANLFFNLPLATRLILQGWAELPAEHVRLAAALGFSARDVARHLERPMLRRILPGAFALIFLICTTSFSVALILGGGPRATTLELAIYQAFRFDFDLGRAAMLAVLQLALCAVAALAARALTGASLPAGGLQMRRAAGLLPGARAADAAWIALAAAFLLAPLAAVALRGLDGLSGLPASVWAAAGRSLLVALAATVLCLALALPIAATVAARDRLARTAEVAGYLTVALSPLALGTGLFILIFPLADPVALALPITAAVNAVMALPFALRVLIGPMTTLYAEYGRLAASLSLGPAAWLRLVLLPRLGPPIGFAAGVAAALSMGDLGVIALFGAPDAATLPLEMFRLMGAYRMDAAAGAALVLLALTLGLFATFDLGGRLPCWRYVRW